MLVHQRVIYHRVPNTVLQDHGAARSVVSCATDLSTEENSGTRINRTGENRWQLYEINRCIYIYSYTYIYYHIYIILSLYIYIVQYRTYT